MNILEAISARVSVRDYASERVPTPELRDLVRVGEKSEPLSNAALRFRLVEDGATIEREVKGILGDYGKVIRAPHYLVVTGSESPAFLVDAGYRFEQVVLEATRRGLGTCWVGGFFHEPSLRAALGLDERERVVALSPIGRAAGSTGLLNRAMKAVVRSSTRKSIDELFAWGAPGGPLPDEFRTDARWQMLLEAARRAPSWSNKQPWRFVVTPEAVLLYKQVCQIKEGKDYHLVDCGIVMAHVRLAAQALAIAGSWRLEPFTLAPAPAPFEPIGRFVLGTAVPGAEGTRPAHEIG